MKSSFIRRTKKQPPAPPGTRPSSHNGQLLVSTGLHELDEILGGGLQVGSILLVEEDQHTSFYYNLLRYFVAEGLAVEHALVAIGSDGTPTALMDKLPLNMTFEYHEQKEQERQEEAIKEQLKEEMKKDSSSKMTIAWQYEKYLESPSGRNITVHKSGSLKPTIVRAFCHSYDLSKPAKEKHHRLQQAARLNIPQDVVEGGGGGGSVASSLLYPNLYKKLFSAIEDGFKSYELDLKTDKTKNILRIAIQSFASPLWGEGEDEGRMALQFLHALRGLLRNSMAVCIITFPAYLYSKAYVQKVEQLSDWAVLFESFASTGAKVTEAFQAFDGRFFVKKLPHLDSLVSPLPETLTYVFKLKRRKLHLEIPHLGPTETRSSESKKNEKKSTIPEMLCAPGPQPSKLDF